MTESEWLACDDLVPMLIYLRGEVEPPEREPDPRPRLLSSRGDLVSGEARLVSSQRLRRFAQEVAKKWWDLPLDESSRRLVACYQRFLAGDSFWPEFQAARARLGDSERSGERPVICTLADWSLTPFGMAELAQDLAWVTACQVHKDRIEDLERNASEDEKWAWGFFGYDFPEFGATGSAILRSFPPLLREVVGNPFRDPPSLGPGVLTWQNGSVVKIAEAIYEERNLRGGKLDPHRLAGLADALEEAGCTDPDILRHLRWEEDHARGCWVVDWVLGKG